MNSDRHHWQFTTRIGAWLQMPADPAGLVVVRLAVGCAVAWFALDALWSGSVTADYIRPRVHLTYLGFDWVRPWPGIGMYVLFGLMLLAGIGVAVGFCYRLSACVMLLTFAHAFLIERSLYNNHSYLLVLLAALMNVLPLHGLWSVDALRRPELRRRALPLWMPALLRFQVGIVYFYGGVAKLNTDWLRGQPMRMWLKAQTTYPVIGEFFTQEWMVQFFVWSGLAIDLLAVPLLLWRRTRPAMFAVLVLFHLLNSTLFNIGVFPWLAVALTTVFFPTSWPRRWWRGASAKATADPGSALQHCVWRRMGVACLGIYVGVQILIPLRQFCYPGDPSWTERGHQFAWRMMLRQKRTAIRLYVTDPNTGRRGVIDVSAHLNPRQAVAMSRDPDLILQFAHKLAGMLREHGIPDAEIRAQALCALNGRKPQLLIDPQVDLARQHRSLRAYDWVLPLQEPYKHDDWQASAAGVELVITAPESATP